MSRWKAWPIVLLVWQICAVPCEARDNSTRIRSGQDLDRYLLTPFFESFEKPRKSWIERLPVDVRMFIFLQWLDQRLGELPKEGRLDLVVKIHRAADELHKARPRNLFHLFLLASTEEHLGNPRAALELLDPVPAKLCDPGAVIPAYDFPSPLDGEIGRVAYLKTIQDIHFRASWKVRESDGLAARLRGWWHITFVYLKAAGFVSPAQEVVHLLELVERAREQEPAVDGIPPGAIRALEEEHPVWSFVLPDTLFRVYAFEWLEEQCFRVGQRQTLARQVERLAGWLTAERRRRPGDPFAAFLLAGLESGRGRQAAALETLGSFWSHRTPPFDGRYSLGSSGRPLALPELAPMAALHAALSWRQRGSMGYLHAITFYTLRSIEALPVPASSLLAAYLALAMLCLARLAIRVSPAGGRLSERILVTSAAWLSRHRHSRLSVELSQSFPQPEDSWRERPVAGEARGCDLASLVAAFAVADTDQRAELVSLLTTLRSSAGEKLDENEILARFIARSPGIPDYWSGLLRDLSFCQFEESERPIIELVSNAVDAYRMLRKEDQKGEVEVYLLPRTRSLLREDLRKRRASPEEKEAESGLCLAVVMDEGCGMSPQGALFDLLVPLTTTKQGSDETIGRFGVGFFSVLRYLSHPRAHVFVSTSDSRHTTEILIEPPSPSSKNGSPEVSWNITKGTGRSGTRVEVHGVIDRPGCEALLRRTFRFLPSPSVCLSSPLSALESFCRHDAGGGVELLWREVATEERSRVSLVVRGEVVAGPFELGPPGLPGLEVGICLPASALVAMSRNLPVVDEALANALEKVIAAAVNLGAESWALLNLVAELADRLRAHHREPHRQSELEEALRRAIVSLQSRLCHGETLFLPLGPGMERIDAGAFQEKKGMHVVFLHPRLFHHVGTASLGPYQAVPGVSIYALPMRDSAKDKDDEREERELDEAEPEAPITIQVEKLTFLDRRFRPGTALGRAACRLLASTALAKENSGGKTR